jgi:hypothetical protein
MDLTDANWRKSSYSSSTGGNCVEVAVPADDGLARVVAVRDSKDPGGPRLAFAPGDWQSFMRQVKTGALGLA